MRFLRTRICVSTGVAVAAGAGINSSTQMLNGGDVDFLYGIGLATLTVSVASYLFFLVWKVWR